MDNRSGFSTREDAVALSVGGPGLGYVCWACGHSASKAVPKRRLESGKWTWGMYHAGRKAPRDHVASSGRQES